MAKSKFITITGTNTGVGTTTIANYMAVELARRGHITLLIEFKTRTGLSVYMQKGLHESRRSLSEVMSFPEKLNQNTIRSSHNPKLRYLCMNFKDDNLKMRNYQPANITHIITKAKKYFEYVILDLPADNLESTVTPLVMGRDFIHKPDHQIIVMDESACSMKYLNDLDNTMYLVDGQSNRDTTFILNRVEASHYHDYILEYLPSLSVAKVSNLVYLPAIEGLTVLCNSGNIYKMGVNKKTKTFCKNIDIITDIVEKDLKNKNIRKDEEAVKKESFFSKLFGKKKQAASEDIKQSSPTEEEYEYEDDEDEVEIPMQDPKGVDNEDEDEISMQSMTRSKPRGKVNIQFNDEDDSPLVIVDSEEEYEEDDSDGIEITEE